MKKSPRQRAFARALKLAEADWLNVEPLDLSEDAFGSISEVHLGLVLGRGGPR